MFFFLDSYLGPNDIDTVKEVSTLEPISLKFDDMVDDQQAEYGKNCY